MATLLTMAVISIISCSSDDPAEQLAFTPGEYRGTYSIIIDYSLDQNKDPEVDTMKFTFTIGPPNTLAIRLDPYDTQDRDFCDWNCNWTIDRDSLMVMNCTVHNSICNHDENPCVTYYHYVDDSKREFVFYKHELSDDIFRKITLWVP